MVARGQLHTQLLPPSAGLHVGGTALAVVPMLVSKFCMRAHEGGKWAPLFCFWFGVPISTHSKDKYREISIQLTVVFW